MKKTLKEAIQETNELFPKVLFQGILMAGWVVAVVFLVVWISTLAAEVNWLFILLFIPIIYLFAVFVRYTVD